jgi:phage-related protein (TIGR01555 family)
MSNGVSGVLKMIGQALNLDAWFNPFTGFGTARDKTQHGHFAGSIRLPDMLLTDLYNHDDIARKVVALPATEMFREGYTLSSGDPEAAKSCKERAEVLDLFTAFQDAITWGRLYGGGVLLIGADDGRPADLPLMPERVRSVDFFDVFDRRRAWPWKYNQDPRHPQFGKPEVYALQSLTGGIGYVHASRLVVCRGAHTDDYTRRLLNSWDFSVLQNVYDAIQHFHEIFQASRIMMTDASQGVFKMKGLMSMIAGGQRQLLETRAQMLDMGRSVARSVFLDADENESFDKVATQFAGVGDQLTQAAKRLSAATGIPVLILMGETPSGLNASGDSNVRIWYDSIKAAQVKTVVPHLVRIFGLIGRSLGYRDQVFKAEPKPLWQETPQEQAARRLVVAQTDQIYIQNEVISPEVVQQNRFHPDGWSAETKINPETPYPPLTPPRPLPAARPGLPPGPPPDPSPSPSGPSNSPAEPMPGSVPP